MVGFQHDDVRATDAFHDELRRMAEVSQEADGADSGVQHKADRVLGIVWDGKSVDAYLTNLKGRAGDEHAAIEFGFELALDGFPGIAIAIDGDVQFGGDGGQALDVVVMLVGDENARQTFRSATKGGEALADLTSAEAGIDKQARFTRFQVSTIATGTTA